MSYLSLYHFFNSSRKYLSSVSFLKDFKSFSEFKSARLINDVTLLKAIEKQKLVCDNKFLKSPKPNNKFVIGSKLVNILKKKNQKFDDICEPNSKAHQINKIKVWEGKHFIRPNCLHYKGVISFNVVRAKFVNMVMQDGKIGVALKIWSSVLSWLAFKNPGYPVYSVVLAALECAGSKIGVKSVKRGVIKRTKNKAISDPYILLNRSIKYVIDSVLSSNIGLHNKAFHVKVAIELDKLYRKSKVFKKIKESKQKESKNSSYNKNNLKKKKKISATIEEKVLYSKRKARAFVPQVALLKNFPIKSITKWKSKRLLKASDFSAKFGQISRRGIFYSNHIYNSSGVLFGRVGSSLLKKKKKFIKTRKVSLDSKNTEFCYKLNKAWVKL